MTRTKLSSKGQVVIPKPVRDRHGWRAGAELEVEDRGDSVLLRAARAFPRTRIGQVRGCLRYRGPRVSLEEMDAAVREEAKRRR